MGKNMLQFWPRQALDVNPGEQRVGEYELSSPLREKEVHLTKTSIQRL